MKRLIGVLAVAAAFLAAPAQAGGYVGASGGSVAVKSFCDGAAEFGASCDDSASGFRVFGGVESPGAALELGYVNLGKVGGSIGPASFSVTASGFDVSALFGAQLGAKALIFTRIGIYRLEEELTSNFGLADSASSTGLTFGFGVRFEPSERVALRVEWQRYGNVGEDDFGKSDVDFLSAGVLFRF